MTKRALDAEARLEAMKAGTGSKAGPPARMHKPDATTLWKGVHSLLARCAQDTGDEKVAPGATAWENVHSLLARCEINMDEARDEDTPSAPVPANEEGGEGGASCKGEEEAPEEGPAVADRWRRMWVSAARLLAAVGDASGAHSSGEDMLSSTEDAPSLASMGKEVELRRANTELSASRLWADFLADKLQVQHPASLAPFLLSALGFLLSAFCSFPQAAVPWWHAPLPPCPRRGGAPR